MNNPSVDKEVKELWDNQTQPAWWLVYEGRVYLFCYTIPGPGLFSWKFEFKEVTS